MQNRRNGFSLWRSHATVQYFSCITRYPSFDLQASMMLLLQSNEVRRKFGQSACFSL